MAGSSAIKAGEGFIELFLKSDKLHAGLTAAGKKLAGWSAGLGGIGAAIGAASGAVLAPLMSFTETAASTGDKLKNMSQRTGMSVEALSELDYVVGKTGATLEDVETAVLKMNRALGKKDAADNLKKIGLTMADLSGLTTDQKMEKIFDAIVKIQDPAKRGVMALKMFGMGGVKLQTAFAGGAESVRNLRQELVDLGGQVTGKEADAADEYGAAWLRLTTSIDSVKYAIGATLIPVMTEVFNKTLEIAAPIGNLIKENKELFVTIFKVASVAAMIGSAFVFLGGVGLTLSGIIIGLKAVLIGVAAVVGFMLSPIGAAIAAVVALAAGFVYVTGLSSTLIKAFNGITAALMGGKWGLAGSIMMKSLEIAWVSGVLMLKSVWIDFKHWFFQTFDDIADYSKSMWEKIVDQVAIEILGLQGILDKSFDSATAMAEINKDKKRREREPSTAITNANKEKNEELEKINKRLDDAKKELDDLIAKATGKVGKKKFLPYDTSTLGPKKPAIPPSAMASTGTFSGFAARILGGRTAQTVNERIAAASEETNDKLDELIEAAKAGGAEWAP